MQKVIYIYLTLLLVCFSACQEDDCLSSASGDKVQLSSLSLRLSDVMSKDMVLSRADADKPTLANLKLFIFSGGYKVSNVDIPQEQIQAYAEGNEYDYEVTGSFAANTGENIVYALGNTSSAYYNSQTLLGELDDIESEDDFKKKLFAINSIYATNQSLPVSISSIFLTGGGTIQVSGTGTAAKATGTITLKRPIASIEFTVNTTATNENNSIEFIPQTYKIYNVCQNALVISDNSIVPVVDDRQYYETQEFTTWANQYDADNNVIAKTCQFYLPENIQSEIDGIDEYSERDERDPDTREWKYAPKKSTYVVISGTYSEKDQNGTLVNQGTTSYTIHLGDFSTRERMGNFSVERNARYHYNVTVQGVTSIITEAQKVTGDGDQPGAEGIIIGNETASEIFDLDCTYEQMIVSYDLAAIRDAIRADQSELSQDEKIANAFILKTSTPFDLSGSEYIRPYAIAHEVSSERLDQEKKIAGLMDYKWVYFCSQASSFQLSPYPGDGNVSLIDPYDLCVKLGNLVKKLLNNDNISTNDEGITVSSDNKVYFTAFVNEYYYDTNPLSGESVNWATFTRQNDRTMTIASDMNISPDGYSIYAKARTSISQRSIQTFYNASVAGTVNAIGLETYCENSSFLDYDTNKWLWRWTGKGTSDVNGRKNMIDLIGLNYVPRWDIYVNIETNGYLESSQSLSHKIENSKSLKNPHPFYACLSRNRDLNGNDKIDDNEIRWYLASGDQYTRLQIGSAAMSDAAKLFQGDKTQLSKKAYPDAFYEEGVLYYTSTYSSSSKGDARQLLWAAEVGAFGARKQNQGFKYEGLVRCVRNLPSEEVKDQNSNETVVDDKALGDVSYDQGKGDYIFDFGDRLDFRIYRSTLQYGPYSPHYEEPALDNMADLNRLPQGFVVAKNDVNSGATYLASDIWKGYLDPCANYSQTGDDQNYRGYWRVPNLREMMVLTTKASDLGIRTGYYAISTGFSGNTSTRPGFSYDAAQGFVTTQGGSYVKVRCVRDMINGK